MVGMSSQPSSLRNRPIDHCDWAGDPREPIVDDIRDDVVVDRHAEAEACDWQLENLLLEFPRPSRIVGLAEYVITVNVHRQQQSADCERCRRMLLRFTRQKLPLSSRAYTL